MNRRMPAALLIATLLLGAAEARETTLDRWLDRELLPHMTRQLTEHPRFKGETVLFVVLQDGAPAAVTNTLALSLRDRLLDAAVDESGISIGWRQGDAAATAHTCNRDRVHYYIGVETGHELDGRFTVRVRALDVEQREWVGGFGRQWSGYLTTSERRAVRESDTDTIFLGARDVPFAAGQTDLLANHLAHELACTLHRQVAGDYVVEPAQTGDDPGGLSGTVELIGNNLVRNRALEFTSERQHGNAILSGKAHHIDGNLYQYWVSVTPSGDNNLSTVSASAYVLVDRNEPVALASEDRRSHASESARVQTVVIPGGQTRVLLGSLTITRPTDGAACPVSSDSSYSATRLSNDFRSRDRCSLLRATAYDDAVVFLLQHQTGYGLVRLGDSACRSRTTARLVTSGNTLRFPVAFLHDGRSIAVAGKTWPLEVHNDIYYAIAVADSGLARRLANHIDRLPLRCGGALRYGLQQAALGAWLRQLAEISAAARGTVEWRALEVEDLT